jgi:hypothetical protein
VTEEDDGTGNNRRTSAERRNSSCSHGSTTLGAAIENDGDEDAVAVDDTAVITGVVAMVNNELQTWITSINQGNNRVVTEEYV